MSLLRLEELVVGYGQRRVLGPVSGQVRPGRFVCLLGPNGAGKSTLLKSLARLLKPLGGAVVVGGRKLEGMSALELARRQAVVLTQRPSVGMMRVAELVALGRHPHTGLLGRLTTTDLRETLRALRLVGAGHLARRPVSELSDGEKQKVMIARALAQKPRVVLLDEPTIHLDLKHRLEVVEILGRLCRQEGLAVVAAMHDVELAWEVADAVVLVGGGKVLAWGPPERVLTPRAVARLYGIERGRFSPQLGRVECCPRPWREKVTVLGGMGRAGACVRVLVKHGFSVVLGIVHPWDVDCHLGRCAGARVILQGPEAQQQAAEAVRNSAVVVDTGFPPSDESTLKVLRLALSEAKALHSLRPPEETAWLFGEQGSRIIHHPDAVELLHSLLREGRG